jgi:hypothetical protein
MGINLLGSPSNRVRPACNHWILIGIEVGSGLSGSTPVYRLGHREITTRRLLQDNQVSSRSPSVSTGASFQTEGTLHPKLSYLFENEGADVVEQAEDEGPYDGTTRFTYRESDDRLVGYYYTGPARASEQGDGQKTTYGTAEFTRVSDEPQK